MPYKKAVLDNEVEEERRMFYVGMTRAKKKLHLYSIEQLNHKNTDISRFIRESQKNKMIHKKELMCIFKAHQFFFP